MLRQGEEDGITAVITTPHILSDFDFQREREIIDRYFELKQRAEHEGLDITIHLGSEIYIQPDLHLDHKISTLNGSNRYFLVEFPMGSIPPFVADRFFDLVLDGKTPIIAHPERNVTILKNPQRAYDFVQRGALLQINAGSLQGKFGQAVKTLAMQMIECHLAHFVASDSHNAQGRPLKLREARDLVEQKWDPWRAERLFADNPRKVLAGEKIIPPEPIPIASLPKKSLRERLRFLKEWRMVE